MSRLAVERAYVGMGSNLDDPVVRLQRAFGELDDMPDTRLVACSKLYGNPPMGPPSQPDYVNAVAALDTTLSPHELLAALHAIERAHGRIRNGEGWGPRTLDLDLLLYGSSCIDEPGLRVPHPGIAARPFVLVPLSEVAPEPLAVPGHGPLSALLAACDSEAVAALQALT